MLGREESYGRAPLFGHRLDDVAHRLQNGSHREWHTALFSELVTAPRQLDDVTCCRAQPERGAVDQPKVPPLQLVHRPAPATLNLLRQKENSCERRAQVVDDRHQQFQAVGARELRREIASAIASHGLANPLDRGQRRERLPIPAHLLRPRAHDLGTQHVEQEPAERAAGPRIDGPLPVCFRNAHGSRKQREEVEHLRHLCVVALLAPSGYDPPSRSPYHWNGHGREGLGLIQLPANHSARTSPGGGADAS